MEPLSPESPSSTLLCSVPEIIELHEHNYSNGKGELGIFVCVPPFYMSFCIQTIRYMSDIFLFSCMICFILWVIHLSRMVHFIFCVQTFLLCVGRLSSQCAIYCIGWVLHLFRIINFYFINMSIPCERSEKGGRKF